MPDAYGPVEAGPESETAVEPQQAAAELASEDAGAELDVGLELGLAHAGYLTATRAGGERPLPAALQARAIGRVQRQHGNFAAQRMLKRAPVQRADPRDHDMHTQPPYHLPPRPVQPARRGTNPFQRAADDDDWLAERIEDANGGGQPLEPQAQARLEAGLGDDLADVRVHTDTEAAELASAVDAVAFTSGRDIFFGPGSYQPDTRAGLELLAHEAAHTVQQASGPVAGTPADGGVLVSDPAAPFEQAAEYAAQQMMRTGTSQAITPLDEASAPVGQSIQRAEQPKKEEEEQKKAPPEAVLPDLARQKQPEEAV
jgi:Domain of unknown function (DUF4157)